MMNPQSAQRPGQPVVITAVSGRVPLPNAWSKAWERLFAHRLIIYICVLLLACIGAYGYGIRTHGIFACQADGYGADRYLADCNVANYADYEHGAFQFDLEPAVQAAVRNADVLFLGNSRLQIAFSTAPTAQWFAANPGRYYLMGFGDFGNSLFEGELLQKIRPHPKVYIIDVDHFFERSEPPEVRAVLHDPNALKAYEGKRFWQPVHQRICGAFEALCGHQLVVFRSRDTGAYYMEGRSMGQAAPVSYKPAVDQPLANTSIATAVDFLSQFTQNACVILTIVPTVDTELGTAKAIASGVGLPLVTPEIVAGLRTRDGSHLDQPSAQRWAEAFFQVAGPQIRSCLDKRTAAGGQSQSSTVATASVQSAGSGTAGR
ncbi:MAG TPA: hypothetical protein VMB34_17435 [Acetobacteraceae bacterium]|nr:hypothetical protein [Acetobacteraceae bacterium]